MTRERIDLLVRNAGELVTVAGGSARPRRGREMAEIGLIQDGAVAVKDGRILAVGKTAEVMDRVKVDENTTVIDAAGKVVLPGLVDPHTHVVFAGSREYELEMKIGGVGYLEILARGGGILDTVRATRAAGREELIATGLKYLGQMLVQGTTTAEAKSGYGLTLADEVKTLEVIRELAQRQPVDLVPTFLGAHAIPPEYKDDPEGYVDLVVDEMLPAVAREGLAEFCDVFCEEGVFSVEQTRRILARARDLGLKLKLHADEIVSLGGAELAAELGATSADHLVQVSEEGIRRLSGSRTVAVLLPATTFCLMGSKYAPAREMIEQGVAVALASDFNPGSSPVNSLQIVMGIACRQLKMKPAEVITAVTINAAHAIGRAAEVGSLEPGKKADLVIFDAPTYRYLMYRFGTNLVQTVVKSGRIVVGG
ncbi:imidazolonepropionase [Desulfofundulus sp. TPOSR]|uniref:imidazolonepropionase n=1 Tax=Desulfofundulus sp. TPOSR TaxID=2714340 RepID=UPI00140C2E56|nr:imidazolonepropionase [Desulfofundulus sp. TPOSR]NHM26496.1 imidazolonepropionase [Desulfofundulus sp. TPOSR]